MAERGLCSTCANDEGCTYPRDFPVRQCEEFSGISPRPAKLKKNKKGDKT